MNAKVGGDLTLAFFNVSMGFQISVLILVSNDYDQPVSFPAHCSYEEIWVKFKLQRI